MLDERTRKSFSRTDPPRTDPGTPAFAAAAETRDWVAEFRREQAHLIRTSPGAGASRLLPYGIGGALALALTVALTAVLPGHLPGTTVPGEKAASTPTLSREPASELAEAREEGLTFDLARAHQDVAAARAAHAQDIASLRAAHAREVEALRAAAAEAEAAAEAKGGVLARDLETAQAGLAAAQRQTAEATAEAAAGRDRSEQLARQLVEAKALAGEGRAGLEAALAQTARERDEVRTRLAEMALATPPPEATKPEPAAALQPVDWTLFSLRLSPAEDASTMPLPAMRDPQRLGPDRKGADRKAGRRARDIMPGRNDPAPRADRPGRTKAGAARGPAATGGTEPALRLPEIGLTEPDA